MSGHGAILDGARKKKSRKKSTNSAFMRCDEWDFDPCNGHDCFEHAKWAVVLEFLGIEFSYQPQHIGCTYDLGMKPTFLINGKEGQVWLHCCKRPPTKITIMTASMVADSTNTPVAIIQSEMFVPDSLAQSPNEVVMQLWYSFGEAHAVIRYICETKQGIKIGYTKNILDCCTKKIREAFRRGCELTKSKDVISHV